MYRDKIEFPDLADLPSTIKHKWSDHVFQSCNKLTEIKFPDNIAEPTFKVFDLDKKEDHLKLLDYFGADIVLKGVKTEVGVITGDILRIVDPVFTCSINWRNYTRIDRKDIKMSKDEKLYNYCFDCGYLGTKDNPKSCDHVKFKQITTEIPALTDIEEFDELQFQGLIDYIYSETWMKAKVYVDDKQENSQIIIRCELTKTQARKPRWKTIEVIKYLSCVGFKLEFTDPNNFAPNSNLIPVLYEISKRSKALFNYSESERKEILSTIHNSYMIYKNLPEGSNIFSKEDITNYDLLLLNSNKTKAYGVKFISNTYEDSDINELRVQKIAKLI